MNVLLFTHANDIDGMGSIVLSKLAFDKVEYIPCETFEITKKVGEYIKNKEIYKYDFIYVTDLCIKEPLLTQINEDEILKNKIRVIDHHKSEIDEGNNKYDFVDITVKNEEGLCCGTSLFYEELLNKGYISRNKSIDEFVFLTRLYDTWEWKNIYNNELAYDLSILFGLVDIPRYVDMMVDKCMCDSFCFNEHERLMIDMKKDIIRNKVINYVDNLIVRDVRGYKAGICFIDYEYRNDIGQYLRENDYDVDFVMMIMLDRNNISFRAVKDDVDVSKVATYYGGKGHVKTGACPISKEKKNKILELILK